MFRLTVLISACGDGNSSSDDNSAQVTATTADGATATFNTNETTVDEVFEFFYDRGGDEFTGTIRWGDDTETRVRGSGIASHIYRGEGSVSIAIQIDGGQPMRVGSVNVAPLPQANDNNVAASSVLSTTSLECDIGTFGEDILELDGVRYVVSVFPEVDESFTLYDVLGPDNVVFELGPSLCSGTTLTLDGFIFSFSPGNPTILTVTEQ